MQQLLYQSFQPLPETLAAKTEPQVMAVSRPINAARKQQYSATSCQPATELLRLRFPPQERKGDGAGLGTTPREPVRMPGHEAIQHAQVL